MTRDLNDIAREGGPNAVRKHFDQNFRPIRPTNSINAHDFAEDTHARIPEQQLRRIAREIQIRLLRWDQIRLGTSASFLVRDLIPFGLVIVYGAPKCGKTFWIFDLVMHVALGWDYRGHRVKQGAIVYCLFEGQQNFAARKEAFRQRHLAEYGEEVPFYLVPLRLQLVQDHRKLIDAIRQTGNFMPRAVILDTLNRSFSGDENSAQAMSEYIAACDAIREAFDCATIVVHHSGIDGGRLRGSSALLGAADAQIAVKKNDEKQIEAVVEYMKDGSDGHTFVSRLEVVEVGTDAYGDPITSCVIVPVEETEQTASATRLKLTPNERTMLTLLSEAGKSGLTIDAWNERARAEGLGEKRRQILYDTPILAQKKGAYLRRAERMVRQVIGRSLAPLEGASFAAFAPERPIASDSVRRTFPDSKIASVRVRGALAPGQDSTLVKGGILSSDLLFFTVCASPESSANRCNPHKPIDPPSRLVVPRSSSHPSKGFRNAHRGIASTAAKGRTPSAERGNAFRGSHPFFPASNRETDETYGGVVAALNSKLRVVSGSCGLQWIVQKRKNPLAWGHYLRCQRALPSNSVPLLLRPPCPPNLEPID